MSKTKIKNPVDAKKRKPHHMHLTVPFVFAEEHLTLFAKHLSAQLPLSAEQVTRQVRAAVAHRLSEMHVAQSHVVDVP